MVSVTRRRILTSDVPLRARPAYGGSSSHLATLPPPSRAAGPIGTRRLTFGRVRTITADQRKRLTAFLAEAGHGDARWLADVEAATLRALAARGSAFGGDLVQDEPRLGQRLVLAGGKRYQAEVNITSRVLFLMAADG